MNITYHDELIAVIVKMDKDAPKVDVPDDYEADDLIPIEISVRGAISHYAAGVFSRVLFRGIAGAMDDPGIISNSPDSLELTDDYRDSLIAVFRMLDIDEPEQTLDKLGVEFKDPFSHTLAILDLIRHKVAPSNRATVTPPP